MDDEVHVGVKNYMIKHCKVIHRRLVEKQENYGGRVAFRLLATQAGVQFLQSTSLETSPNQDQADTMMQQAFSVKWRVAIRAVLRPLLRGIDVDCIFPLPQADDAGAAAPLTAANTILKSNFKKMAWAQMWSPSAFPGISSMPM